MDTLLDLLVNPGAVVGALAGLGLAFVFHWLAPIGTDAAAAGVWFVAIGWLGGLLFSNIFGTREK